MQSKWFSPTSIIWLLCHVVIGLIGFIVIGSAWVRQFAGVGFAEGVGGSLVATAAAGIALYLYVSRSDELRTKISSLQQAGLEAIFAKRSVAIRDEYESRISKATSIDIMGFGLSHFRQDFSDKFAEWSKSKQVRVILMDHNFPNIDNALVDQRDKEEGHLVGSTKNDILSFLSEIRSNDEIDKSRFEVRLLTAIPSINMMRIDDDIFWGPFLLEQQSRNTPTLLVRKGGFMWQSLNSHFEAAWTQHSKRIKP